MSPFLLPAFLAAVIAATHVILGGRAIARPLLDQRAMPYPVTLTHYYCWHLVTITLGGIAGAFGYAAVSPGDRSAAVLATLFACAFCFWGLGLVLWKRQRHRHMPQWMMFAVLSGTGFWALAQ